MVGVGGVPSSCRSTRATSKPSHPPTTASHSLASIGHLRWPKNANGASSCHALTPENTEEPFFFLDAQLRDWVLAFRRSSRSLHPSPSRSRQSIPPMPRQEQPRR